jgi:hypothetical protein
LERLLPQQKEGTGSARAGNDAMRARMRAGLPAELQFLWNRHGYGPGHNAINAADD